jgi:hypothetical protein
MTSDQARTPQVLHVRFRLRSGAVLTADAYERLLGPVAEFTPVVQALPPGAALAGRSAPAPTARPRIPASLSMTCHHRTTFYSRVTSHPLPTRA